MNNKGKITKVKEDESYYSIDLDDSSCFGLDKKYGFTPKIGDPVVLFIINGSTIRGVTVNGVEVFYKSDLQLETERKEWLENYNKEKQDTFEKEKSQLDSDYDSLPLIFKQRIDKFRNTNPNFRVDYERYEMFCIKEALKIVSALGDKELIREFAKANWNDQKRMVPNIDDGHSGNTFGMACKLAYWYLTDLEMVTREHGALVPLVGCKDYGCPHLVSEENENENN